MKLKKYFGLFVLFGIITLMLSSVSSGIAAEGKININSASVKELQQLKGIGKTIAKRIVEYREEVSPFKEIAEIKKVKGVGNDTFAKIADQITVEDEKIVAVKE